VARFLKKYLPLVSMACCGVAWTQNLASPPAPDDKYTLGVDSQAQPEVPKGKIFQFTFEHSKIFPGTRRTIKVYVPAQYTADKPACVYIGLDYLDDTVPIVFDNLIHKHDMPVTIAIGLAPGMADPESSLASPRFNRSFEFDSLSDNLARFLIEELLPEVQRRETPDRLPIRLSADPNDRAVGGVSTGGIGAFTLAWERPDSFRRVFTAIGTFVGMRGGDRYPVLVRKTEPKPIRIYMQDGSNDEWMGGPEVGDWWMSNQTMQRALDFAGYQVEHVWGEGTHNRKHAVVLFPDAMRWLWKDWPQPVVAGESQNTFLKDILLAGETWELVRKADRPATGVLAADHEGRVVFQDMTGKSWRITDDGELKQYSVIGESYTGMAFGPDGRVYVADAAKSKVLAYTAEGKSSVIATGIRAANLVVNHSGALYATEPAFGDGSAGKVWLIGPNGKTLLDDNLNYPSGIALSPDGLWLAVAESRAHWGFSYRVQRDGTVKDKQQFYWFHEPDDAADSGAGAWVMDRAGRLYSATRMGVQVFDRNGRVRAILPVPGGAVTGLSFGGAAFDTLYVSCADHKVYRRTLRVPGAPPWAIPFQLPRSEAASSFPALRQIFGEVLFTAGLEGYSQIARMDERFAN
jgi:sugar lactone lactonase YvrE/enterochelin esterase-like enzyme